MPIESSIIPPAAADYLNSIAVGNDAEAGRAGRIAAASALLDFCNRWFATAKDWRRQSYEQDWAIWRRNSDSIFDPSVSKKKRDWQSRAFVDITPSHREAIQSALYKLVMGSRPILEVRPRTTGDRQEAEDVKDLILREMEKARFEVAYDQGLEDCTTYGSGFFLAYFDEKWDDRQLLKPQFEEVSSSDPLSLIRSLAGKKRVVGYDRVIEQVLIYRGVRFEWVDIWDFFPDPKALNVAGNPMCRRYWLTYGEIVDGARQGYYLPEAVDLLRDEPDEGTEPEDRQFANQNRNIADLSPGRTDYAKRHELKCIYVRLPQKWVMPFVGLPIIDPDRLIPARVIFHRNTICAVELNQAYDGEPPFLRLDYMHVNGRFYARGIPEMIRHSQAVVNEVVNQRLDEGNLALNEKYGVIEKAILNPKELEEGGPGLIVRIDNRPLGPNGDVRQAIFPLGRPDVKRNAGFSEVYEWERIAQERTSANRVTLGTVGQVRDSNQTLGGQVLLKQQAGEKFAYIAMAQEFSFMAEVFSTFWKLIYRNLSPQDVIDAIGEERSSRFVPRSPEELQHSFRLEPQGIFEMENRAVLQAQLQSILAQFAAAPWVDHMAFFDQMAKNVNLDPDSLKIPQAEAADMVARAQMIANGILAQRARQERDGQRSEKGQDRQGTAPQAAA